MTFQFVYAPSIFQILLFPKKVKNKPKQKTRHKKRESTPFPHILAQKIEDLVYQKCLAILRAKERKEKEKKEQEKQDPRYLKCKQIASYLKVMNWDPMFVNRGVGGGLQNLGNSCFLNATLQCLAYTAPFAQILQTGNHRRT